MLTLLVLALLFLTPFRCDIIVNTTAGQVRGVRVHHSPFHSFLAFKGIPYAEPPVGELRFANPVPHHGWTGVRDASTHGNVCPTNGVFGITRGGDEDCLFLNVYTPDVHARRPVMFWIHGGAFLVSNGNTFLYGPGRLMREHIVVVTINYRLGTLGFLSTGDRHAQGNYGLKDAILALKWVQANIESFGGDPSQVTIAGESAGSAAVHHLMISKMARGLFQRAIMMSGCVLMPFSFQADPRPKAEQLGKALGLNFKSTEELVQKLRRVNFRDILRLERDIFHQDPPVGLRNFDFGVVVEPEDSIEERMLTDTPENVLLKEDYETVPAMIGTTNMEGILYLHLLRKKEAIDQFNEHLEYFVPLYLNISSSESIKLVGSTIKEAYLNDKNVSHETLEEFARFMTDASFKFGIDQTVKLMAKKATHPIYYYEMSYQGVLNFVKNGLGFGDLPGACHADDLFYLFEQEAVPIATARNLIPPTDHAFVVRDRIVKLWSNFVKTGNPTPYVDDLITLQWPQYSLTNEEYLEIDEDMNVKNQFKHLRMWYELVQLYSGHA